MQFKDGNIRTVARFSPHMETTDEGYLLCKEVPISRVGQFEYSGSEAGLPSKNGKVLMSRTADELFSEDTIQSFNLKPVVIGHSQFADPDNWKDISIGIVQNVRQGQGDKKDLLLADLLITDRKGINLVKNGRFREVSCGYDAEPISDGVGYGHQVGIVGNHVALVNKARCGEKCKIMDGFMSSTKFNPKTILRSLFRDGDEDKFNEQLDQLDIKTMSDEDPAKTPVPQPTETTNPSDQKTVEQRLEDLELAIADIKTLLAEKQELKEPQPSADSDPDADPEDLDQEIVSDEEVKQTLADSETLCPGMKRPAADAKGGKFTRAVMDRTMRNALKGAGVTMFGDSAEMDSKVLKTAFTAAVEMKRRENNPKAKSFGDSTHDQDEHKKSAQELMNSFWNK